MNTRTETADAELLEAWCRGDRSSGNELICRHFDAVRRYINRLVVDRDLAQDILAQTFENVVRYRDSIRDPRSVRSYFLGVARNTTYRNLRGAFNNLLDSTSVQLEQIAVDASDEEAKAIAASDANLLYWALRELPLEEQITLELYIWEELTAPEIAEAMSISLPMVKHRIRRGRKRLEDLVVGCYDKSFHVATMSDELQRWFMQLQVHAKSLIDGQRWRESETENHE